MKDLNRCFERISRKRGIMVAVVALAALALFSSCKEKDSLSKVLKRYPKEVVQAFYERGMIVAPAYDESALPGSRSEAESFTISPMPAAESQEHNECGAMSSAFVLRFYGEDAKGLDIYGQIEEKNPDGTINPKPLKNFWDKMLGYKMNVFKGDAAALKSAVGHNIPVIVLINCPGGWHYVPVVGYDQRFVYIQDSVPSFRNSSGGVRNRKESWKDFEALWNVVLPNSDHLMFVAVKALESSQK